MEKIKNLELENKNKLLKNELEDKIVQAIDYSSATKDQEVLIYWFTDRPDSIKKAETLKYYYKTLARMQHSKKNTVLADLRRIAIK